MVYFKKAEFWHRTTTNTALPSHSLAVSLQNHPAGKVFVHTRRRVVKILERLAGQQFASSQGPPLRVVSKTTNELKTRDSNNL